MSHLTKWLTAIVNAGSTTLNENDPLKKVIRGVNRMALLIIALNLTIGTFVYLLSYNFSILAGICVETPLLLLPLIFNRYGRTTLAGMTVYCIMSFATLYYGCLFGRPVNAVLMIPYLMAIGLFMFNKRSLQLICGVLAILIVVLLELNYQYQYVQTIAATPAQENLFKWSAYTAILLLIIASYTLYSKNYRALLNQLREYARQKESESENKDKFISSASHELRVSHKSIIAVINILKKRLDRASLEELGVIVNDLQTSCDISFNLNDNILEYQKIQVGRNTVNRKNSFDARVLFGNTTEVYRYLAREKDVRITDVYSKSIPRHIIADDVKIRHIYTNILHNAIKFSPNDAEIVVTIRTTVNNLVFRIKDCGTGISEHVRLYEAFSSTNPDGLGLGLYIVKELVHTLQGKITVKSDRSGTSFTVVIPLREVNQAAVLAQREGIS
jgi:signal transduction histidine kinase